MDESAGPLNSRFYLPPLTTRRIYFKLLYLYKLSEWLSFVHLAVPKDIALCVSVRSFKTCLKYFYYV